MTSRRDPDQQSVPSPEEMVMPSEAEVEAVELALDAGDVARAVERTLALHSADAADLIDQIDTGLRELLVRALGTHLDAEILTQLRGDIRAEVIEYMGPAAVADAITGLEIDDAVEVLEGLDETARASVLEAVSGPKRAQIERGFAYPDDSAGRLMQRTLIAVPEFWNIGRAIDYLRESDSLPDDFYELFIVDPAGRPVGTLPLDRFVRWKRSVRVGDVMDTEPHLFSAAMDQEDVAYQFQQYDLASAGVVDEAGRLVGVIMIDDIVDVIHEEAEEDLLRLAGVSEAGLARSVATTVRSRMSWLFVNLLTAILASVVIFVFEGAIEEIVAAAVLMPIVASMGGNAGTQTLAVTVRAMATHSLTAANAGRIVTKEVLVGGANGLLFAALVTLVGSLWFSYPELGLVFGASMLITMGVAGLAGILIPLGLGRLGMDPAVASSVFVTAVTDVVGFSSFLGLVAWLLI